MSQTVFPVDLVIAQVEAIVLLLLRLLVQFVPQLPCPSSFGPALSEAQVSRDPTGRVGVPSAGSGLPPITQMAFSACRAHSPRGSVWYVSIGKWRYPAPGIFPNRSGLPETNGRSAST